METNTTPKAKTHGYLIDWVTRSVYVYESERLAKSTLAWLRGGAEVVTREVAKTKVMAFGMKVKRA